jgi:hypothetical protein
LNLNFWTVDELLAKVDLAQVRPNIDLSNVTFLEPFALVYLGAYLRHHNRHGKSFTVNLPTATGARGYLARMRFWERFNFSPDLIRRENLVRLSSSTSFNDILDIENTGNVAEEIGEGVLRILRSNVVSVNKTSIAELVSELVDNFAQHSQGPLAICTVQYYPNAHRVDFAIGDCGIGIRNSLSSNPQYQSLRSQPHNVAALKAFEPLVTRRGEGGTGLTEVAEGIRDARGMLVLSTGDGWVSMTEAKTERGFMYHDLPGVQIELSFPEER